MASEAGLPATVFLAILVILAFGKALKSILHGRDRALRSACLVAAALVPLHGIFDVPGHRITLAFSAILLYSLSLGAYVEKSGTSAPWKIPFRLVGFVVMTFAILLLSSQSFGIPRFSTQSAETALARAKDFFKEDKKLQEAAIASGIEYQPDPSEDPLEKALGVLDEASNQVPLDRQIPRYKAFIAFYFDDKQADIEKAFALERALDPTWVEGPYRQGVAWAGFDISKVMPLWEEALRRADLIDSMDADNRWSRKKMVEKMRSFAKGRPEIDGIIDRLSL